MGPALYVSCPIRRDTDRERVTGVAEVEGGVERPVRVDQMRGGPARHRSARPATRIIVFTSSTLDTAPTVIVGDPHFVADPIAEYGV